VSVSKFLFVSSPLSIYRDTHIPGYSSHQSPSPPSPLPTSHIQSWLNHPTPTPSSIASATRTSSNEPSASSNSSLQSCKPLPRSYNISSINLTSSQLPRPLLLPLLQSLPSITQPPRHRRSSRRHPRRCSRIHHHLSTTESASQKRRTSLPPLGTHLLRLGLRRRLHRRRCPDSTKRWLEQSMRYAERETGSEQSRQCLV